MGWTKLKYGLAFLFMVTGFVVLLPDIHKRREDADVGIQSPRIPGLRHREAIQLPERWLASIENRIASNDGEVLAVTLLFTNSCIPAISEAYEYHRLLSIEGRFDFVRFPSVLVAVNQDKRLSKRFLKLLRAEFSTFAMEVKELIPLLKDDRPSVGLQRILFIHRGTGEVFYEVPIGTFPTAVETKRRALNNMWSAWRSLQGDSGKSSM